MWVILFQRSEESVYSRRRRCVSCVCIERGKIKNSKIVRIFAPVLSVQHVVFVLKSGI